MNVLSKTGWSGLQPATEASASAPARALQAEARSTALLLALLLVSCSAPDSSGVKAIVGARIEGPPAIEYSVVVIADGKFRDVGPQATTPVPKGAELTDGKGRVISGALEAGRPADLVIRNASTGSVEATMKNGEWMK